MKGPYENRQPDEKDTKANIQSQIRKLTETMRGKMVKTSFSGGATQEASQRCQDLPKKYSEAKIKPPPSIVAEMHYQRGLTSFK